MLTLNVPPTDDSGRRHKADTHPGTTADWLARLPLASPVDTAQQLIASLYALNRQPLDAATRESLLALYRPVVARAAASLESLLAEAGVPPHAQQRQIGVLLRELLIEYAVGYKHILLALTASDVDRAQPKLIAEIAARLLAALRDVRVAAYATYCAAPDGLWREMHQLHQLALDAGTADKAMDDAPSAGLSYRQALLLALADPPHMSRTELARTRQYLDGFASLAELRTATAPSTQHGFPIPTDSDRGPAQAGMDTPKSGLLLDTEALCRHLHDTIVRLRIGDSPRRAGLPPGMEKLSPRLGKKLLKQWRGNAQRAFKRYPAGSAMQLVAGVSAIHRLLEHASPRPAATNDDDALPIGDVVPLLAASAPINVSHWTVDNDSAAGLALSGAPDAPLNLKVGDALALRDDADTAWSLGVIRWIKMHDAWRVELGVERLSPRMQPVWVRPLRGRRKASPEPALLVPGLPGLKQPDRLLLPRTLYQLGMDAIAWQASRQYMLTFGQSLEHTPGFDLIDFTIFLDTPPP